MRPFPLALLLGAAFVPCARAGDLRNFDDAALRAVQFVDEHEGWAVGDDGVVWHSIDGGKNWDRQPTGVRASLRSVHFLNPYTGWVAGREELPHCGGSTGVLLFTRDGGEKWQRVTVNALPGLNAVRFVDATTGYVAGDGSDSFPSGVFRTADGGRTWQPLPGPRAPSWLAADFREGEPGALAGAWNRLAAVRDGRVAAADADELGGRSVRGLQLVGKQGVAVGDGGLVLLKESTGTAWSVANLRLPREVQASWDFHAVHSAAGHVWAVGRPGSAALHSADGGATWEVVRTGQPAPLHGVFFHGEKLGWAVGEIGTILATTDGGKIWKLIRRGGQRSAVLFVHARAGGAPLDAVAVLGGEEGYLASALRVVAPGPATAAPLRAGDGHRFTAAVRQAGGMAGEMLWQFHLPEHLARADRAEVLRHWDGLHGDKAAEHLLRQLVLTLRVWRPDVVVTDNGDARAAVTPADALVAEAVQEAFRRAADAKAFPEQVDRLGLEPWKASKLYGVWEDAKTAHVTTDLTEAAPRLASSPRDFAAAAAGLLSDAPVTLPSHRSFRLLASRLENAAEHKSLMQGLSLAAGGLARRPLPAVEGAEEVVKAVRQRRNLQALAEAPPSELVSPDKLLAQIGPALDSLSQQQAVPAAFAVANQFARAGQWTLAREAFLLMAERYPAHPLTADACRWLIRHNSSSEARRRHELGQFLVLTQTEFRASMPPAESETPKPTVVGADRKGDKKKDPPPIPKVPDVELHRTRQTALLGAAGARRWYEGSLEMEPRLAALGTLFAADPPVQFCLQAARRNLGDFEPAGQWYTQFATRQPDGPWRSAALAEQWLVNRSGAPPKPVAACRLADSRPFLDGKFDDACWQGLKPLVLKSAAGDTGAEYPTEVMLSYDKDFLYVGLRCRHPEGKGAEGVKDRGRDADLRAFDRVSVCLDLDRDYSTFFRLEVDQRGCVHDDCWGDATWDPKWFVAVHHEPTAWHVEAAVPLVALTGDVVTVGRAWACNVSRVLPGRGVQAFSLPADVEFRPEGMGLLIFTGDPQRPQGPRPAAPMTKAP